MQLLRRFKKIMIDVQGDHHVLMLGKIEMWEGVELCMLRECLFQQISRDHCKSVVIDMTHVKYLMSGFFGMLCDFQEAHGVQVALTPPQPNVQKMLWFNTFFHLNAEGNFDLELQSKCTAPEPDFMDDESEQLVIAAASDSKTSSTQSVTLLQEACA